MKKTVNVNVGGFSFIIEESAYEQLNMYLNNVRRNLGNDVDTNEVMNDIESRIAELFREALAQSGKEVVESALIDRVISVMGKPEDYGDGTEHTGEQTHTVYESENSYRAFFRDPDNKMLGGVAAGLGNYFGWNPLAFRIAFLLLLMLFGSGILLYIVLWILIPEAKTTAEKLRMHGQPVNVDTIKKRFNDFKNDVSQLGNKANQQKMKDTAHSLGNRIESMVGDFVRILLRVIGLALFVAGIALFVFLLRYFFIGTISFPQTAAEEVFFGHHEMFFDATFDYYAFTGGIALLVAMMMFGLITSGLDLLFGIRMKSKPIKYATITFSIVAVCGIIYGGINLAKNYTSDKTITTRYDVPMTDSIMRVNVLPDEYFSNKMSTVHTSEDELIKVQTDKIVFGYPRLTIRRLLSDTTVYLEVERNATGPREIKAIENAEAIKYNAYTDTSSVTLSPVFTTAARNKFRNQNVELTLYVPDGTIFKDLNSLRRILDAGDSDIVLDNNDIANEPYIMTKNGLMTMSAYEAWQHALAEEKKAK